MKPRTITTDGFDEKIVVTRCWREDGGDLETGNQRLGGMVAWQAHGYRALAWKVIQSERVRTLFIVNGSPVTEVTRPEIAKKFEPKRIYKSQARAVAAVERWLKKNA